MNFLLTDEEHKTHHCDFMQKYKFISSPVLSPSNLSCFPSRVDDKVRSEGEALRAGRGGGRSLLIMKQSGQHQ